MRIRTRSAAALAAGALAAIGLTTGAVSAWPGDSTDFASVPAQSKTPGIALGNVLSPGLTEYAVAQGSTKLENGAPCVQYYGYDVHVPGSSDCSAQAPFVPLQPSGQEANKTEPDKNTYLRLYGQTGADPSYDYGSHFLFQGHETGSPGYITRINLDADAAHRVTLLATTEQNGTTPLPNIDGSTWDPWAKRLLFTSESVSTGGVWQATTSVPSTVVNLQGIARASAASRASRTTRPATSGSSRTSAARNGTVNTFAKQPNSFIYRFMPVDPTDLTKGGKLQALQVQSLRTPASRSPSPATGSPTGAQADADITSGDTQDLHTYGTHVRHEVGHAPRHGGRRHDAVQRERRGQGGAGDAVQAARRTGSSSRAPASATFFFDETGDTDNRSQAIPDLGGFGGVQKLVQSSPSADTGTLTLFYKGDQAHTGLDNVTFLSRTKLTFVEDARRHAAHAAQRARLGVRVRHARRLLGRRRPGSGALHRRGPRPVRHARLGGGPLVAGNEGDNEITGIHASDGDATRWGILGAKVPDMFHDGWRLFWTQQHGDNATWEVVRGDASRHGWGG